LGEVAFEILQVNGILQVLDPDEIVQEVGEAETVPLAGGAAVVNVPSVE
jgi:hypothetical protein